MIIETKIINKNLPKLPTYGTSGAAGVDLVSCNPTFMLGVGESVSVNTGIAIWIKDPNYAGIILPRSGLGSKYGIVLGNLVGLIDSDYQGELIVNLWNRGLTARTIYQYDRDAQLVIVPVQQANYTVVEEFSNQSIRGTGGFGSTGFN